MLGSYPKSVMAPQVLWMLELASQRGFRGRSRHPVCARANPQEFRRCWLLRFLWEGMPDCPTGWDPPVAESVPGSSESRETGHAKGVSVQTLGIPAITEDPWCCGELITH
jgi:hypothetical protein